MNEMGFFAAIHAAAARERATNIYLVWSGARPQLVFIPEGLQWLSRPKKEEAKDKKKRRGHPHIAFSVAIDILTKNSKSTKQNRLMYSNDDPPVLLDIR